VNGNQAQPGDLFNRRLLSLAAPALSAVMALAFYPQATSIKDEALYLADAYILRRGTIYADVAHVSMLYGVQHAGHVAPIYPPGLSLLILPLTLIDWRLAFAANIALLLVGAVLFGRLLVAVGLRRDWLILYLFFPPLVLFSRTLMTEVPSATLMVGALLLYARATRRGVLLAGSLLGIMVIFRYANIAAAVLFLAVAVWRDLAALRAAKPFAERRAALSPFLLAGAIPWLATLLAYNLAAYGTISTPGYATGAFFDLRYFLPHLAFYVVDLALLYPAMLLAPLVYRGPLRAEIVVVSVGMLLTMSSYYYLDIGQGIAQDLLVGARLLLPISPLLLLAYAQMLDRLLRRLPRRVLAPASALLVLVLAIGALTISVTHQQRLLQAATVRDLIYQNTTPADRLAVTPEAAKFLTPAWGERHFVGLPADPITGTSQWFGGQGDLVIIAAGRDPAYPDFRTATAVADAVGGRLVIDTTVGWRLVMWRAPSHSVAAIRSGGQGYPPPPSRVERPV
jgi:hypothetical protein